jgi:hypothetical protein
MNLLGILLPEHALNTLVHHMISLPSLSIHFPKKIERLYWEVNYESLSENYLDRLKLKGLSSIHKHYCLILFITLINSKFTLIRIIDQI